MIPQIFETNPTKITDLETTVNDIPTIEDYIALQQKVENFQRIIQHQQQELQLLRRQLTQKDYLITQVIALCQSNFDQHQ